jgi:hypothetical protein
MLIVLGLFAIARFIGRDRSKRRAKASRQSAPNSQNAKTQLAKGVAK